MELTGKIKLISPVQDVTASFKKRELVITTDEQYPQDIMIEFTQMRCDDLNAFNLGEQVKVSINIRGREWINPQGEAKYFNSIQGWRIERLQQMSQNQQPMSENTSFPQQMPSISTNSAFEPATNFNESEPDDLPF